MRKKNIKLHVRRDTIRSLRPADLVDVAGGDSGDKGCTTASPLAAGPTAQSVCSFC